MTSLADRVLARTRHAEGGGASGLFQTTNDVSDHTAASLYGPGEQAEILVRFSSTIGRVGSPDSWRDVQGFAIKFLTTDGEYDVVGNNSPVFFINDDGKFASLVSAQHLRGSGAFEDLFDHNRMWQFFTAHPETAHQVTWLLSDRGIPRSWRHQDGFGTLQLDERGGRAVLGQVPLPHRPGKRVPQPGAGGTDRQQRGRLLQPRPRRGDRARRAPELDVVGAGDAVRGRGDVPIQPLSTSRRCGRSGTIR